jgi:hypothetical protein
VPWSRRGTPMRPKQPPYGTRWPRFVKSRSERKFAEEPNREFPRDTMTQGYWLPSIRAAIDLHEGHGAKAIESLQPAISFELGRPPPFSTLWKDADADIPPLREAKTEAARLSS